MTTQSAASSVRAYADRFDRAVDDGTAVIASPLGAWLLLALVAPAATGDDRRTLEAALGTDAEGAGRCARDLLRSPHPAISAAVAVWHRDELLQPSLPKWMRTLRTVAETGRVPSQVEIDRWAARETRDIIDNFPLLLDDRVAIVFANALATDIEWRHPFELGSPTELRSAWSSQVSQVLQTPHAGHAMHIATTEAAGDVAVHATSSRDGVTVVSVIAADDVAPSAVRAAAHDVAARMTGDPAATTRPRRLARMPLGDGPAWTITERLGVGPAPETYRAFLPAWRATVAHDLLAADPSLGFRAACSVLGSFSNAPDHELAAKQVASAAYDQHGFEAAALTAIALSLSARTPTATMQRQATLRFGHPYAVVAVATDQRRGPWEGMPVFSAWVTNPTEPTS
jgi:hypothetical protein